MADVLIPQVSGGAKSPLQAGDLVPMYRIGDAQPTGYVDATQTLSAITTAQADATAAGLTADQALLLAQSLQSVMTLQPNGWDASTNIPALSDATGVAQEAYVVNVTGTIDLGSGAKTFNAGTVAYYAGGVWNVGVSIVAGVSTFNTRTGNVVSVVGDYTAADITNAPSGNLIAVTVQAALNELQTQVDGFVSGAVVTVGDSRITPQVYEDGVNSSGNGTEQRLGTLTDPATGLAYTGASAASQFPNTATLWGAINPATTTYDDCVLQEWLLSIEGGVKALHCDNKEFVVNLPNNKLIIPASTLNNTSITSFKANNIIINGNGSAIRINNTDPDKTIFWRQATSLADASNGNQNFINKKVHINGWVFVGQSGTNSKGIDLWASYNSIIENCDFNNLDTGLEERFCLGSTVRNNNFFNMGTYGYYQNMISASDWADVTDPGAQTTSQTLVQKNRFSCGNAVVGVYMRGGDTGKIIDNIFETPGGAIAQNAIYYDYGGSNNSKGIVIGNNHLEGEVSDAWYRFRMGGNCTAIIDFDYEQAPVLENAYLVNLQNEVGSNVVIIRDHGYHSGGGGWKCKYAYPTAVSGIPGGGGGFVFQNDMFNGNPQTAAALVNNPLALSALRRERTDYKSKTLDHYDL
jgi:hypothetical protein